MTIALLFASSAEAQSLFSNYQLLNLAENAHADQDKLQSLSSNGKKELANLDGKAPEAQSLASKATSTVMDGMKHFTS